MKKQFLERNEVARLLNMKENAVSYASTQGRLPPPIVISHRKRLYSVTALEKFLGVKLDLSDLDGPKS